MSPYYYPENRLLPAWPEPPRANWARRWALGLAALLLVGLGAWWLHGFWLESKARQATVWVLARDAAGSSQTGSGVLIDARGFILTNRHVVEGCDTLEVVFLSGTPASTTRAARVKARGTGGDFESDWALLRVEAPPDLPAVELARGAALEEEQEVRVLGFPRPDETVTNSNGPQVKILQGILNRVDRDDSGRVVRLTHSASTAEGMSGGPVLQGGKLIGLTGSALTGGAVTANENYALPVDSLWGDLEKWMEAP